MRMHMYVFLNFYVKNKKLEENKHYVKILLPRTISASQSPLSQGALCTKYTIHNKYSMVSRLKWYKKCLHITHTQLPNFYSYDLYKHISRVSGCKVIVRMF